MDTLYDILGALPHDDAEGLRTAFRKAVKSSHPDLCPGDPEAAVKFRQIVRANEILCDKDQRAAYDHLLVLAQLERDPASAHPIAARVHKIASGVLAFASLSIVTASGYLLFMHMSVALVAPSGTLSASRATVSAIDLAARLSASIAAVSQTDVPDPAAVNAFIAKAEVPGGTSPANALVMVPAAAEAAANIAGPAIALPGHTAAHGVAAFGNGDVSGADPVTQLDQKFTTPYVNRGILFFREKKDGHAFPDLVPLKRAEKPGRPKSLLADVQKDKGHQDPPPKSVPLPPARTETRLMQLDPWYASATFQ